MRRNLPGSSPNVPLTVIGVVRSAYTEPESTPIQAALNRAGRGTIEIAGPYREGLAGLDGFGYAWLLTWLHQPGGAHPRAGRDGQPPLRQVPYLLRSQRREMGIFATRGPRRVNPLGLSLVQLLGVTRGGWIAGQRPGPHAGAGSAAGPARARRLGAGVPGGLAAQP